MNEIKIIQKLKKMPLFTMKDFRKIIRTTYAKKHLERFIKKEYVFRIQKNKYTVHKDPLLIAPWIYHNSYIGSYSALQYHGLITQLPQNIICITGSPKKKIKIFDTEVVYKHSKYIFGYEMEKRAGIKIPISLPEKAVIDSINIIPLHITLENIEEINKELLWEMAKKMPRYTQRRIAYIIYKTWKIKKTVKKGRIIYLDPLKNKKGKLNKKYNIIDNM